MGCPPEATFLTPLLCSGEEAQCGYKLSLCVSVASDGWKVGSVCVRSEWMWGADGVGVSRDALHLGKGSPLCSMGMTSVRPTSPRAISGLVC